MSILAALLVFAAALPAFAGYGGLVLRLIRLHKQADPLRLPYALALGMGTLAYLVLAVGLLGILTRPVLAAVLAGGWVLAVTGRQWYSAPLPSWRAWFTRENWPALVGWGFVAFLALVTVVSALRVPDGLDWDGLSYHLAAPKIYLREGRIGFIPYDSHTHFPFTVEMLFTVGLAFGGPGGAKLFHWGAGWLTAIAVGVWTCRLTVRGERVPAWAGAAAAVAFGSMPLALWEMGTAYIDLGTALFQFLALAALLDAVSSRDGRPSLSLSGAALAGILTGFALGTKYTALIQLGLLGLGLLWLLLRAAPAARLGSLGAASAFVGLAVLVASPWYIKNWLWVHNPVYPFFFKYFPNSYSWTAEFEAGYAGEQALFGLGKGWEAVLGVFWNLGLHGRAFYVANPKTLLGDKLGSLGPLWAGILPLALWGRQFDWRMRACLLYGFGSIGVWLVMTQQTRYLMPVFAALAVVVGVVLAGLESGFLRRAATGFLAVAAVLSFVMHKEIASYSLQVLTGQISERDYLRASLPGVYDAAEFVNTLPENSKVALYQDTRGFYFDREYFWANPGQHNHIPYDRLDSGDGLIASLRGLGITHVLINFDFALDQAEAPWYRLLMDAIRRGRLEEVFRSEGAVLERRGVMVYAIR